MHLHSRVELNTAVGRGSVEVMLRESGRNNGSQ